MKNYWEYNNGKGKFIVIECHGGPEYCSIVTDEGGDNKVFSTLEEASKEAENCQDGMVVQVY